MSQPAAGRSQPARSERATSSRLCIGSGPKRVAALWQNSAMDLGLAGLSIVVTGGSSGVGLATARLLLDEGAIVTRRAERNSQLQRLVRDISDKMLTQRLHELVDNDWPVQVIEADASSHLPGERRIVLVFTRGLNAERR